MSEHTETTRTEETKTTEEVRDPAEEKRVEQPVETTTTTVETETKE